MNKKVGRFSVRAILAIVIVLLAAGGIGWFGFINPNNSDVTACKAPEGFFYIENTWAKDPKSGEQVLIVRGLVSNGEPVVAGKQIVFSVCGSPDPKIMSTGNLYLIFRKTPDDIERVYYLPSVAVGIGAPLALATQP